MAQQLVSLILSSDAFRSSSSRPCCITTVDPCYCTRLLRMLVLSLNYYNNVRILCTPLAFPMATLLAGRDIRLSGADHLAKPTRY